MRKRVGANPTTGTICPSSQIGRDRGLKILVLWVRVPPWTPLKLVDLIRKSGII